jgi:hypothetical protein
MLTAKENMRRTVFGGGEPDRFVNQYEALHILFHPWIVNSGPPATPGGGRVVNAWGVTNEWPENTPGQFPVHTPDLILLKDIERWRDYVKAPPLRFSSEEWGVFKDKYEAVDKNLAYVAPFVAPGLFEQTHHFSEITNALMYYLTNPDEMHELIKYLTEWELELAEGICTNLKPDAIFHHDDWGSELSTFLRPEMFAEFFVEPYKQIYGYYHDHGVELVVHHSDSYAATLVPFMIEMGIDVWQGCMHSNKVPELLATYRGRLSFMGNIDNKEVDFDGWTQEDVQKAVKKLLPSTNTRSYIPCITQGGPGSCYSGVYTALTEEIDRRNSQLFGVDSEAIAAQRLPVQLMF